MVQTRNEVDEDRRAGAGERRRYNRRQPPSVTPPYYETFERIALALESIADALNADPAQAGEAPKAKPAKKSPVAPPRTSTEGTSGRRSEDERRS